jgi:hypothetical protein
VRVKAKDALMLALMPVSEIKDTVYGVMGLLLLVLFLATGVCVLYSILHVHQPEEASLKSLGHFVWNKTLGGRLVVIAVIAGIAVFISGVFLESLLRYAHTFSYCEGRASEAAALYTENADAVDEMKLWFQDECLTRCRIAGMILKRKDLQDVTPGYLQRLSDSLGAYSIHVFDSEGNPLKNEFGEDISIRFEMSGEEFLKYLEANDGKVMFTVPEGLDNQVRIICNDCAVNTDNLTNEYNELFTRVTVSQNKLIIFYANKPLFYGSIAGVLSALLLVAFILIKRKKKSKEQ